jgi:hypothetical protein
MATWKQVLTTADDASYLNSNVEVFKTIAVTGSTSVVADAETDTLTLVGAGSVALTTGDDTITVTGTDVDVTAANLKTRLGGAFAGNALTIGQSTSEVTIGDNLTIAGNLTVSGGTTTVTSETVNIADNEILLNSNISDNSGSAATDGGVRINRGFDNALYEPTIFWDESANSFVMTAYAATDRAVDANGAMTDQIAPLRLASGVPSSNASTGLQAACLGALYMDTSSKKLYVCTSKDNSAA